MLNLMHKYNKNTSRKCPKLYIFDGTYKHIITDVSNERTIIPVKCFNQKRNNTSHYG